MSRLAKKKNKILLRFSEWMIIFTSIYITFFSVFLELDSEMAFFIKSISNIGVEHRIWFLFWCLFVGGTLFCNYDLLQRKYCCKMKILKVLNVTQFVSLMLAWLVPNNADKGIGFSNMLTGEKISFYNISQAVFGEKIDSGNSASVALPFAFKISERHFHQAMSSVFGLSVTISLIIFAVWVYKHDQSRENFWFAAGLCVYMILTCVMLSLTVSGLAEWAAILVAFAVLYYYNHMGMFEEKFIDGAV